MNRLSPSEREQEFLRGNLSLAQKARQGANFDFTVHWNDTASRFSFYEHVATASTNLLEAVPVEGARYVRERDVRQFRHVLAQAR